MLCLEIFKCIVMYSYVPPEALVSYITCLCKVVNLSSIASDAWDTMRKLMGTHLGKYLIQFDAQVNNMYI